MPRDTSRASLKAGTDGLRGNGSRRQKRYQEEAADGRDRTNGRFDHLRLRSGEFAG